MKKFRSFMVKMTVVGIVVLGYLAGGEVKASVSLNQNVIQEKAQQYLKNVDVDEISKEDVLEVYDEISKEYTPDAIADMIEENTDLIEEQGISKELVSTGTKLIRQTDTREIRKIVEENIDVEDIKRKLKQGYTPEQIVNSVVQDILNEKKFEIGTKLLLSNKLIKKVLKSVLIVLTIWFIYETILRWIIYEKAGRHGWSAIIPLYRQITMYQICGLSPWLMLLWFVPVIGWIAMFFIAIIKRFYLAKKFRKGTLFGLGMLILPPIFKTVLAFSFAPEEMEEETI